MPTPFLHLSTSVLGLTYLQSKKASMTHKQIVSIAFTSTWADLDLIPALWTGSIALTHHKFTHTFLAALLMALLLWRWSRAPFWLLFLLGIGHPLLDLLTIVHSKHLASDYGIKLFWPVSEKIYSEFLPVFTAPYFGSNWSLLFSFENVNLVLLEASFLVLCGLGLLICHRRKRMSQK